VWYAVLVHPWQAPDEYLHYEYLRLLDAKRTLALTAQDRSSAIQWEVADTMWIFEHYRYRLIPTRPEAEFRQSRTPLGSRIFSTQPPLYYLISLPFYWASSHWSVLDQLYLLRLYSISWQILTVVLTYQLARLTFGATNRALVLSATTIVALWPQYTFISASYNNDNLAPALVTLSLYALLKGWHAEADGRWWLLACACAILSLSAKRTAVGIIPVVWLGSLVYAWVWLKSQKRVRQFMGGSILASSILNVLGLLILIWRPLRLPVWLAGMFRLDTGVLIRLASYLQNPFTVNMNWHWWFDFMLQSFWGNFGWLTVPLSPTWATLTQWTTIVILLGCLLGIMRTFGQPITVTRINRAGALSLYGLGLLFTLLSMMAQYIVAPDAYTPQGRYLFPFMAAFGILTVWGWAAWWPQRWQHIGLLLGLGTLVLFDSVCWAQTIIPFLYS
jgi:4-amino-4-deoxy-L-arabinose transferase-like glycosyltransferase